MEKCIQAEEGCQIIFLRNCDQWPGMVRLQKRKPDDIKMSKPFEDVTNNIKIRPAKKDDISSLGSLCDQLGYQQPIELIHEQFEQLSARSEHVIFVATLSNVEVVGWIHIFVRYLLYYEPHLEIGGIVVDDSYRGNGIGGMLMQRAEEWAREKGIKFMMARTSVIRAGAHRFYEAVGYTQVKQSKVYLKEL